MKKEEMAQLLKDEIESWDDGYQFHAIFNNDGDGYFDFGGLRIYDAGVKAFISVLEKIDDDKLE